MKENDKSVTQHYSNSQSVSHFILLSVISFGIYNLVWFYRNWKYYKEHKNLNISPGWRTAGLFVPIWGLYLAYMQFKQTAEYCQEEHIADVPSPVTLLAIYVALNVCYKLPDPFWVIALFSVMPLASLQKKLNLYWSKVQPSLPERKDFTKGQIVLIVLGIIWWVLSVIGMFVAEETVYSL